MLTLTQDPARAACQQHATTCVDLLSLAPDVRRFSYTLCNTHAHGYPQVLECVFSHLHHIEDIASLAASCKRLSAAATTAPLTLQLASPRCSSFDSKTLGVVLTSTCRRFPAIRALDLSGTCVEDADVLAACRLLRSLHTLQLANCRKITDALFLGSARPPLSTVTPAVQVMCLQRCFQMTHEALVAIMHTKQGPPLTCLVMSHLELHAWPTRTLPAPPTTLSNLRMLALLNSTLDAAALRALGGCTALCYLFLGGSLTCYTPPQQDPPPARHANLLRVLDANATLRTALHAAVHVEGMRRNDQQQPALALALELTVLLQQLTHVQLLEATFALRGVLPALRILLASQASLQRVELLDLTSNACVDPLLRLHTAAQVRVCDNVCCCTDGLHCIALDQHHHQQPSSQGQPGSGLRTALQAAACCSSPTRHTPLHLASHDGNTQLVAALLRCGARWDLRDRGGNTPLFLACELGHAAVVDALLEAGPEAALVKNNAGELPLYIAALRGHQRCVSQLITNWQTTGVLWQVSTVLCAVAVCCCCVLSLCAVAAKAIVVKAAVVVLLGHSRCHSCRQCTARDGRLCMQRWWATTARWCTSCCGWPAHWRVPWWRRPIATGRRCCMWRRALAASTCCASCWRSLEVRLVLVGSRM